jgi:putative membrane protein
MKDPVSRFLSAEARQEIEERVRQAEQRTAGEIVVMVVPSSHHYPVANLVAAGSVGFLLALAVAMVTGRQHMWDFAGLYVLFFILVNEVVRRSRVLKRLFIRPSDMEEEVEEAAIKSFYSKELYRTSEHTGILIYISLFEHRVRVIADKGISSRVSQSEWDGVVSTIIEGIRRKCQKDAIMEAVDTCAGILERHIPARPGDRNELSDEIITRH